MANNAIDTPYISNNAVTTAKIAADNITNATYVSFEESFIGPSGITFSINTSGNLIMTV
jgi:hypothetical protein